MTVSRPPHLRRAAARETERRTALVHAGCSGAALRAMFAGVLFACVLSGCVLGLDSPAAGPKLERPEDRAETPGPRPKQCGAECRWSAGYWHWDGGGYVWVEGRWESAPSVVTGSTR